MPPDQGCQGVGIHSAASEQSVLEVGSRKDSKDLRDFYKGQTVMARRLGLSISKTAGLVGVFPVCSGQYLPKVVQGRTTGEPVTGSWAPKAQ